MQDQSAEENQIPVGVLLIMAVKQRIWIELTEFSVFNQPFDCADIKRVKNWVKAHQLNRVHIRLRVLMSLFDGFVGIVKAELNEHAPVVIVFVLEPC